MRKKEEIVEGYIGSGSNACDVAVYRKLEPKYQCQYPPHCLLEQVRDGSIGLSDGEIVLPGRNLCRKTPIVS